MHNDRTAKLRRRGTALVNLKASLQRWKSTVGEEAIKAISSTKDIKNLRLYGTYDNLRKVKVQQAEEQLEILEGLVR
jgi:hypothetical protein